MAKVHFRQVTKRYGDVEVIHGIGLDVADGEFIVIVGPSGCGKSTLLRMVAGLETISDGEISIGDRVVNALEPKDRDIAMVFQNYALYPHMSVFGNMAYGLKIRGSTKADIDAKVKRDIPAFYADLVRSKMFDWLPEYDTNLKSVTGGEGTQQHIGHGTFVKAVTIKPAVKACGLAFPPLTKIGVEAPPGIDLSLEGVDETRAEGYA